MTITLYDKARQNIEVELSGEGLPLPVELEAILSHGFAAALVDVAIVPPCGWVLRRVVWSDASNGLLPVPSPGQQSSHSFQYTLSSDSASKSGGGTVTLKRNGG